MLDIPFTGLTCVVVALDKLLEISVCRDNRDAE